MAGDLTDAQIIECFHLVFLQVFLSGGQRRERCVLKGGANLRYFFDSVRYSNDIDLDFTGAGSWGLEQAVDRVLSGAPLARLLRSTGLTIEPSSISKPKQTDTTRRWRLGLVRSRSAIGHLVRTKIEFSHRGERSDDCVLEAVPNAVVSAYGISAPLVMHYRLAPAIEQKTAALAQRSETKARDVFDLDLLFRRGLQAQWTTSVNFRLTAQAIERALTLRDADFDTQVRPFLEPEIAAIYEDNGSWSRLRDSVVQHLVALQSSQDQRQ